MKVLLKANERTQNNGACKIVEIDKYLIINGLIHERKNLKPTNRYCVTPTGDSRDANSAMPSLNQVAMLCVPDLSTSYRDGAIYGTEMVDSEDPTIFYKVFPTYYNGDRRLVKYKLLTDNAGIEEISRCDWTADSSNILRFIGQNKDFIFVAMNRNYNDVNNNGMNYVARIHKTTMAVNDNHFAREKVYPVFENATKAYIMSDNVDNSFSVGYIMKDTWAWIRLGTFDVAGASGSPSWIKQRTLTTYQTDDFSFKYFFAFDGEGSVRPRRNTPCICKATVNMSNDTVQFKEQTINFDRCATPISDLIKLPDVATYHRYTNLKMFTLNNKRYLVMSHTLDWVVDTNELTNDTAWFYLFEVDDENNTLYCLDAQRTNPRMHHVLYGEDGRHLCFVTYNQLKVFSLDENTMTYKVSLNKYYQNKQIQYFGIDKDNNMWLQEIWGSAVHMERIPYNYELFATYDKNTLKFEEGETEKLVNLKIGYRDYYKNYKSKKVKITLDHPNNQLFTSNDTNVIIVDTLTTGLLSIPVKVLKPGYLQYDVEFV